MTVRSRMRRTPAIIPYQELLGNYDKFSNNTSIGIIIPYQELLGNYDCHPPDAAQ